MSEFTRGWRHVRGRQQAGGTVVRVKIDPEFQGLPAVDFALEFLDLFDTRELSEFKVRRPSSGRRAYKGIWGNMKPPRYPNLRATTYRISCTVAGTDEDFPVAHVHHHAGTRRPESVATSVNELLAWVMGHEIFHFLAQPEGRTPATGQLPARNNERGADLAGYEFMYAIREGREPVEVADAILRNEPVAAQRFPYTKGL